MASEEMLTIFCYDISKNRIRFRVAGMLEKVAVRVQKSVFEAWMDAARAEEVARSIVGELGPQDSLRLYAIGDRGYRRTRVYGAALLSERQDFFLV